MAQSSSLFSDADTRMARQLKALGHPARLAIVRILAQRDECICGEIVDDLPLAQSTVSQHLKALKDAGIVQGTIDGRKTCYCLDPEAVSALLDHLDDFFSGLSVPVDCCK